MTFQTVLSPHATADQQATKTPKGVTVEFDMVITTMALVYLTIWTVLAWLYGLGEVLYVDGCGQATTPLCSGRVPDGVFVLPGASASIALFVGLISCLAGRRARGTVIPIAYLIAAAGMAWALRNIGVL